LYTSVGTVAAVWTVRGLDPGRGEIFCSRPDRSWDPLTLLCDMYRVFSSGAKRSGRGVEHNPIWGQSSRRSRVILLLPFSAFVACCRKKFTGTHDLWCVVLYIFSIWYTFYLQ